MFCLLKFFYVVWIFSLSFPKFSTSVILLAMSFLILELTSALVSLSVSELVPANTGAARTVHIDRVVQDGCFAITGIASLSTMHHAIGNTFEERDELRSRWRYRITTINGS